MDIDEMAINTHEYPSLDYQLNVCLVNLAMEITDENLHIMKYLLTGDQGTPKGVLEKITSPLKLFEHLKGRCLLSRDNILFLQAMLYHARRIDLFNKLIEFAKHRGDTLHCYPESDSPVNGYKFVKFHVAGTERSNRSALEAIRAAASTYMNVPSYFVTVQGIQATNSYLITFMVPEHCIESLETLKHTEKQCLLSLGVDCLIIEGNTISLQGTNVNEKSAPGFQINLAQQYYFKKNAALQKQLEQYQLNEIKAEFKLTDALFTSLTYVAVFLFNIAQSKMKTFADTISIQGAHTYFRHSLEKVKELGYDVNVIQSLLEAQRIVVRKQNFGSYDILLRQQECQIKVLEHSKSIIAYERDKLKYFLGLSIHEQVLSKNDEFLLHGMDKSLPKIREKHTLPRDEVMDQLLPYLEEACKCLRENDTTRLKRAFKIDLNEEKIFNRKEHSFIEALLKVESQRNGFVDLVIFEKKVASAVNKQVNREFEHRWKSEIHKFLLAYQQAQSTKLENLTTKTRDVSKMSATEVDSSNKMDQALDKIDLLENRLAYIEQRFVNH